MVALAILGVERSEVESCARQRVGRKIPRSMTLGYLPMNLWNLLEDIC